MRKRNKLQATYVLFRNFYTSENECETKLPIRNIKNCDSNRIVRSIFVLFARCCTRESNMHVLPINHMFDVVHT